MNDTRLLLTCGLPGAGKTSLALRLAAERKAVRLTKDEWLWGLGTTPWDKSMGQAVERELWDVTCQILEHWSSIFEVPTSQELSLFDPPARSPAPSMPSSEGASRRIE